MRPFGPFCSFEAGTNAHNFFWGRAFIIPNSASFPTRNSYLRKVNFSSFNSFTLFRLCISSRKRDSQKHDWGIAWLTSLLPVADDKIYGVAIVRLYPRYKNYAKIKGFWENAFFVFLHYRGIGAFWRKYP